MAFTKLEDWSETAASNTEINGIVLSDNTQIDQLDNIEREHMSQIAKFLGDDTLASATTTDLGSVPGRYISITGTTTITGLGTIKAGTIKYVSFAAALTLTHNATSLILPGAANITTAAGDTAIFVSEGSGNWRCLAYSRNAPPQGWEKIADYTPSALSSIDVTGLSAYRKLRISGYMLPATDGADAFARVSVDNGANWLQGGTDYSYQTLLATGVAVSSASGNGSRLELGTTNIGNAAGEGIRFSLELDNFNKNLAALGDGSSEHKNSAGSVAIGKLGTWCNGTAARNAVQIAFSSGNIASGFVTVEGWRG